MGSLLTGHWQMRERRETIEIRFSKASRKASQRRCLATGIRRAADPARHFIECKYLLFPPTTGAPIAVSIQTVAQSTRFVEVGQVGCSMSDAVKTVFALEIQLLLLVLASNRDWQYSLL